MTFGELVTRLNAATTAIAARLQAERDKLAQALLNAGISKQDEEAALAGLDTEIARLEEMGTDPGDRDFLRRAAHIRLA